MDTLVLINNSTERTSKKGNVIGLNQGFKTKFTWILGFMNISGNSQVKYTTLELHNDTLLIHEANQLIAIFIAKKINLLNKILIFVFFFVFLGIFFYY